MAPLGQRSRRRGLRSTLPYVRSTLPYVRSGLPYLRSRLPYYGYRVAEAVIQTVPRRAGYVLAHRAVDIALVTGPGRADGLRDNLRHVLPHVKDRELRRLVRRNLHGLARGWVDVIGAPRRSPGERARLHREGVHHVEEAVAVGRGVVIVSMHFGSWEAGLGMWKDMGPWFSMLAEVLHPPELFERLLKVRGAMNIHVIPIDTTAMRASTPETARRIGASAMRDVVRTLRSGGVVATAMDRDLIGNGIPLPFFGVPAPIQIGIVDVALRTGATILPVILHPDGDCMTGRIYPKVPYDPSAPRDVESRRVAGEILTLFERVIRANPEHWHVLSPVWPEPRA